ncbi:MAG: tRNA 2-thiouridine(34) synthase MnmA [Eubacteriaceae bacterium]|jgi:tRNA-specific 2-thiouridylase|nr:tRNA 2-thiouridine(34) synthase MnmA [Eubacteriaceae bacterium]
MAKVVVGISGGVDSAVAASLLIEEGHDLCGVFMKNWEEEDSGACPAEEDYEDAKSVCLKLGIPFYTVGFAREYWDSVFAYFLEEYSKGRTPNPDVLCNSEIKFKAFLKYAQDALSADFIATGHYARIQRADGEVRLLKGSDAKKDQSYFLSFLSSQQLSKALFPLGEYEKPDVRMAARKLGLRVSEKKDSTGVCFIGERNFRKFLSSYLPARPGSIVDWDTGEVIGEHIGLMYYTIGQRRGLGIGGHGNGGRWYAASKDLERNILYAVEGGNNPKLFYRGFEGGEPSFVNPMPNGGKRRITVKYRYQQKEAPALLEVSEERCRVIFEAPQSSIAPGQVGAFYSGDTCLGGSIITKGIV